MNKEEKHCAEKRLRYFSQRIDFCAYFGGLHTRQELAWRDGRVYLNDDPSAVAYLELAEYDGKLFVSFPPVPSIPEWILTFFFGKNTPNQFMVYLYALGSCAALTALFLRRLRPFAAVALGLLSTAATNLICIAAYGGVWHEAQSLSFLFCSLAACLIFSDRRFVQGLALFFAALAVGCRPFTVIFIPVLLYIILKKNRNRLHPARFLLFLIAPACVAAGLMAYNYARFGNVLEFGHNYLPDFQRAEEGQFHISYLLPNLLQAIRLPISFEGGFHLSFNMFTANAFYLVNPVILLFLYWVLRSHRRKDFAFLLLFLLFVVCTCLHRTLGGVQFGARYFLDFIPYLALYLSQKRIRFWQAPAALCAFGVALNVYGIWLLSSNQFL